MAQLFNRIFVLGGKDADEKQWRGMFSKCGSITDIYLTKNKQSGEKQGITYITFSKTSEACLAIDEMNGQLVPGIKDTKPIKVILANQKGESNRKTQDEDRILSRLFVKTPAGATESEIKSYFQQYGEVESVKILFDKTTKASKNLAFVRFSRQYHAACALENCDNDVYRPKFADSDRKNVLSETNSDQNSHSNRTVVFDDWDKYNSSGYYKRSSMGTYPPPSYPDPMYNAYSYASGQAQDPIGQYPHEGHTTLEIQVSHNVNQENIFKLFDIIPGLESCNLDVSTGIAVARYRQPQQAAYAKDKINGMEFPPGHRIGVQYYKGATAASAMAPNLDVRQLVETIQKATQALSAAGLGSQMSNLGSLASSLGSVAGSLASDPSVSSGVSSGGYEYVTWCSLPLPPRQPLDYNGVMVQRLFIVSYQPFGDNYLEDVFCRFGNMIGGSFLPGKSHGYIKYSSSDSAEKAMNYLHGHEVCGNKIKVIWADPPKSQKRGHGQDGDDFPAGKRSRTETSP